MTTGPRGGQNYGDGWWEGQCFRCVFSAFWQASSRSQGYKRLTFIGCCGDPVPRAARMPENLKEKSWGHACPTMFDAPFQFDPRHLTLVPSAMSSLSDLMRLLDTSVSHLFRFLPDTDIYTGIDESGKKGIFPSNYVRLSRTRSVYQNWLTYLVLLAFRSR